MENNIIILKKLYSNALRLYKNKEYRNSISLIQNTTEIWLDFPQKIKFMLLVASNFIKMKNYLRAERILLEVLAVNPTNLKVLETLGEIYNVLQEYKSCEKVYLAARKIDFFNFKYSLKSAKAAMKSGNFKRMFRRLKEGYIPEIITSVDEQNLKRLLLEFSKLNHVDQKYLLLKNFRKFCLNRQKKMQGKI